MEGEFRTRGRLSVAGRGERGSVDEVGREFVADELAGAGETARGAGEGDGEGEEEDAGAGEGAEEEEGGATATGEALKSTVIRLDPRLRVIAASVGEIGAAEAALGGEEP